ncbi:GNAT family N-acetyltransferase [Flavobacterium sp.]|uniref:GNAT family N-acetyltransferase n=1 Tax=Flavobacterium sp. TaxID=239 RepID=UPI00121EB943|nr:GNAT family N-acetyltransferase [Flavobacterium sp.]RZJ71022.1 MAG: N-acetyltransferase family protein [Flavobacterium sp.]
MTTFSIREATLNDVQGVLDIVNHAIAHTTANYNYDPQTIEAQLQWFGEKQQKTFPVFVADHDGKVVGFSTYGTFREKTGYRFTVEHSVYVADGFSGKGIGRKLLETLIAKAKEQGFHTMIGGIDASNEDSIAFHRKFGFVECGVIRESAFKFDRWLDLLFMQLLLK